MCVCTAFHVVVTGLVVLMISTTVSKASSFGRGHGAKELWPYFRIRCDLTCLYGYETDIEGNYVCQCHDPCKNVLCFGRTQCVVKLPKLCFRDYCRPRAVCKDLGNSLPVSPSQDGFFLADEGTTTSSDTSLPDRCLLPVTGKVKKCRKVRRRWFYDDVTGTCKSFLGCKMTGNNFRGRRGCQKTCLVKSTRKNGQRYTFPKAQGVTRVTSPEHVQQVKTSALCYLPERPTKVGCHKPRRRWFFDVTSGVCRKFRSCPGSGNNFSKKKVCKSVCMDNTTTNRTGRRNHSRSRDH